MKLGKKVTVKEKTKLEISDDSISAESWSVNKVDNRYIFEYVSGELTGGLKQHEITKSDFEGLCSGDISDYDLILKYDLS